MKKYFLTVFVGIVCSAIGANGALIISGVVDGNESGGTPKAIELYATTNIPNLSVFSVGRFTNGGSSLTNETALPAISISAGSFFYITGTAASETILEAQGFVVDDAYNSLTVANINGDDLIAVTDGSSNVLDMFGLVGQGDTDFYANSVALRNNTSTTPDPTGSVDAAGNFTVTAWTNPADFGLQFGSYRPIPEPSALALCGLGLAYLFRRRR